jgi:hypothetical protein
MSLAYRAVAALTSTVKPKSVTSAELAVRIRAAEQIIVGLEVRHAAASFAWASDSSNAKELDALEADLTAARREVRALRAAFALAEENERAEDRARLASLNASRVHSAVIHFRAAEKAAADLAEAITKAAEARRKLLSSSAKARVSAPSPLPLGSLTEASVIDRLVANEMHRLSYVAKAGALPGSQAPSLQLKANPDAIEPLADQLRRAHDYSIAVLRGETVEPRTPMLRIIEPGEVAAPQREHVEQPLPEVPDFDPATLRPFVAPDLKPIKLTIGDDE